MRTCGASANLAAGLCPADNARACRPLRSFSLRHEGHIKRHDAVLPKPCRKLADRIRQAQASNSCDVTGTRHVAVQHKAALATGLALATSTRGHCARPVRSVTVGGQAVALMATSRAGARAPFCSSHYRAKQPPSSESLVSLNELGWSCLDAPHFRMRKQGHLSVTVLPCSASANMLVDYGSASIHRVCSAVHCGTVRLEACFSVRDARLLDDAASNWRLDAYRLWVQGRLKESPAAARLQSEPSKTALVPAPSSVPAALHLAHRCFCRANRQLSKPCTNVQCSRRSDQLNSLAMQYPHHDGIKSPTFRALRGGVLHMHSK